MVRRNWKRVNPTSLRQAIELCAEHGRDKCNLSVERIAERMGVASHFTLYKWMESGKLPASMILPFENVCGISLITAYLAHSHNQLVIPMPTGRRAEHIELNELSQAMHETVLALYRFQDGERTADATLAAIMGLMEDLAYQSGNIEKEKQPELQL